MQVVDAFTTLHWQYQELSLPPLLPHPHHVPAHLLPSRSTEETPGVHATYERAFWRFHERVPPEHDIPAEEEQEMTEERERIMYEGLQQDGVEPTLGLIYWAEALNELVSCSLFWLRTDTYVVARRTRDARSKDPGAVRCYPATLGQAGYRSGRPG